MTRRSRHTIDVSDSIGVVSGISIVPEDAHALYVFGHGAGAGMTHFFMEEASEQLAGRRVATLRYNFPYKEAGRKAPNRAPVLIETVRAAVRAAREGFPGLPLFAGGKSMGGRMSSTAASQDALESLRGLVFFGFPLHAPGKDSAERGEHLHDVGLPMLFLQGTRDKLANLALLEPLLSEVDPRPDLRIVDDADHGFHVPKRSGRTDADVLEELCSIASAWMAERVD